VAADALAGDRSQSGVEIDIDRANDLINQDRTAIKNAAEEMNGAKRNDGGLLKRQTDLQANK